jgi:hypothetical protein
MISSDLHGVEEPTRWMLRTIKEQRLVRGFAPKRKRTFHQRHPSID